jgi:hypothetical protein
MFQASHMATDRNDPIRKIGLGRTYSGQDRYTRFIGDMQTALKAPTYLLPNIETVRIHYGGPLSDTAVQGSFGARIDPLNSSANSPPPGSQSVETTMAEPGKFQTWTLVLGIGWHLECQPLQMQIKCNSLYPVPTTGIKMPVSPDAFALIDQTVNTGSLGLTTGQTLTPAQIEWGWWQELAFFNMARAYNLVWQWGQQTTIINDSLRFTAYTPSSGQIGGASSSEVDVNAFIQQTAQYYAASASAGGLGSNSIPIPIDRTRIGNMTLNSIAGQSVYRPSRAYETVGATYGGMGLRSSLKGNSEWRRLSTPFLLRPGVPIGLRADVTNSNSQLYMQQWLSASQLLNGIVPADYTAYQNINSGVGVTAGATSATGVIGMEPSLDPTVAAQGITTITDRIVYKAGSWSIAVALKGFELTDDQAAMLQSGGTDLKSMLQSDCGGCTVL